MKSKKYEKKQKQPSQQAEIENQKEIQTGAKKKQKFYNFYNQDGQTNDVVLLKGRNLCECQASKHKLVSNCLNCGRIVCEQEGSGPCLFCGHLVCSEEERKLINSQTKKGENLKKSLLEQSRPKGWEEAILQRDRLVRFDKESEKRTTVIDDESDYFKANSVWLSDAERKKLEKLEKEMQESRHGSRLNKKMTFDFAGRQVIDDDKTSKEQEEAIIRKAMDIVDKSSFSNTVDPNFELTAPIFLDSVESQFPKLKNSSSNFDGVYSKVQDKEFMEMSDTRNCLSMHQPWASLLIAGIKKHEGRTWYTAHRGRLWIASTAKQADPDEIQRMQNFYQVYYNNENLEFPKQYPPGVLLGCVIVKDCLAQEEYRKIYPQGESESPFVLICEYPEELVVKFPNKGQHKIYKLEQNIHSAALKSLQKLRVKSN